MIHLEVVRIANNSLFRSTICMNLIMKMSVQAIGSGQEIFHQMDKMRVNQGLNGLERLSHFFSDLSIKAVNTQKSDNM